MTYTIALERLRDTYPEIEPLCRDHFRQMQERLAKDGIKIADYAPRLDQYFAANDGGWLLHYVARCDGRAVGYSNVYLTNDMHNGELIAREDLIYVDTPHRNGLGRKLVKHILADLERRGVVRVTISPVTDLRVGKIWKRMGFRPHGELLTYTF